MSRYVLTPSAKADLVEIFEYIRYDKPEAAKRVVDKIREAITPSRARSRRLLKPPPLG
jgi:plasmid stabilization system protein ParE